MQQPKPISLDISNKEYYQDLAIDKPILTSRNADWQNIIFEHRRQPAEEIPETSFQQHALLVFLKEVAAEFKMDGCFKAKNARQGEIVLIPADVDYWNVDRTSTEYIVLIIEPQQLLDNGRELFKTDAIELIPTFPKPDPFIYGTALALKQELETNYHGCQLYTESLLNSLSFHLLHKYATTKLQIPECDDGLAPFKLKQVLDLIGDRLGEEVSVLILSKYLNLSPFHFVRQFKKSVGTTPHQYVMQQRVEMAKGLLKQQDLAIADIALDCGFSNQSHLGRVFKRHIGTTPKKYRGEVN